jgi:hypothetical protein
MGMGRKEGLQVWTVACRVRARRGRVRGREGREGREGRDLGSSNGMK